MVPTTPTARLLRGVGMAGSAPAAVQVSFTVSNASIVEYPPIPPTAYTMGPTTPAAKEARGVGMAGNAPLFTGVHCGGHVMFLGRSGRGPNPVAS